MISSLDELSIASPAGRDRVQRKIALGRRSGKYGLSTAQLSEVPKEVYNQDPFPNISFWEESATHSLDLAHNELKSLPSQLSVLADLKILDVSHNRIASWPHPPPAFPGLVSLDVSHNRLDTLASALTCLPALKALACGSNRLTNLSLEAQPHLIQLSAQGNRFERWPAGIEGCVRLTRICLAGNNLANFPDLEGLTALEELDVSANSLEGPLPASASKLPALNSLNLRQNRLTHLPDSVSWLTGLSELLLGSNQVEEIPPGVGELSGLRTLELRENRLQSLPEEICKLTLVALDVQNNRLRSLPPQLGGMTTLRSFVIEGNPLKGFKPTVLQGPAKDVLAALRHRMAESEEAQSMPGGKSSRKEADASLELLVSAKNGCVSLAGTALQLVPRQVWELGDSVRSLDLSGCSLPSFPPSHLPSLAKLEILVLANNRLREWPLPPGPMCPPLRSLDVSRNPMAAVPADAISGCLATLTHLNLSGVEAVGTGGGQILLGAAALQELRLGQCGLRGIPEAVLQLTGLRLLDVSSNILEQVPTKVTGLAALTELDLGNNAISSVPPVVGLMHPTLRRLQLEGNPMRTIRRPIVAKGTPAVLEYLRDRIPQ